MKLQLNVIPEKIHNDNILLNGNIKHQNNKKNIELNNVVIYNNDLYELNPIISHEIKSKLFNKENNTLLFSPVDENDTVNEYYTTDIGELLKYLDFGIITLGRTSNVKKVIIKNKYGYLLNTIKIWIAKNNFQNIKIEISKTKYPFLPMDEIIFEKEYKPNDEEEFYIRIESNLSMESISTPFEICAKGMLIE